LTHKLALNALVADGQLQLSIGFDRADFDLDDQDQNSINELAAQLRRALQSVINHCLAVDAGCLTPSDFALAQVSRSQLDLWQNHYQIRDIYPATPMQLGLLFHSEIDPGAYITQIKMSFEGGIDTGLFQQAWQHVVAHNEVYRTVFVADDSGQMQQIVLDSGRLPWHEVDIGELDSDAQQQLITQYCQQDRQQGISLESAPLMRITLWFLGEGRFELLWSQHHALCDGWCIPLVFAQVSDSYRQLLAGESVSLMRARPYRDYIGWLLRRDRALAEQFWRIELSGINQASSLVEGRIDESRSGVDSLTLTLDPAQTLPLQRLARQAHCTVNILLQAAWGYLLSCYSANDAVVFGTTISGRPAALEGVEQMIGLFINTVPVRVD
ncbi:MAG: condensation domain-containing protein, partial [Psychrosphaera sp.]|nr:condensation domain-containing protein [Psychrosphaera sp.]